MFYGDEAPPEGMGSWLGHAYRQIVSDRIGGRMLTLVADGEEALIAHIPTAATRAACGRVTPCWR